MKIKSRFASGFLLILIVVFTTSALGCSSSGGGDDDDAPPAINDVLPSTLMVTVPKSLEGSGSQQSLRALRAGADEGKAVEAYYTIKSGVAEMKMNGAMVGMYAAVIDELISSQDLSPSPKLVTGKTMKMTQALADKIDAFMASSGFEEGDMSDQVGQSMPVPDFYYDTASSPYNLSLKMTETDEYEGETSTYYTGFYWSRDKKKVKMVMADADPETATPTYSYTITYDDSTKTSAMVMEGGSGTDAYAYTFSLKEDPASSKNGAFVFYESSDSWDSNGDGTAETWYQSGSGYADDAGGSLKVTARYGTGKDTKVETYETAFDASTIDEGLTDDYAGYVEQIDDDMYAEVGDAAGMSGETTDYSVETRVYSLTGVTVDTDYADENYTGYVIYDRPLAAPTGSTSVLSTAVDMGSALYVGSGFGSAADELTAFLTEGSTGKGYVYCVTYNGTTGNSTWKYQGPIDL